jgi:hypothetical protein
MQVDVNSFRGRSVAEEAIEPVTFSIKTKTSIIICLQISISNSKVLNVNFA